MKDSINCCASGPHCVSHCPRLLFLEPLGYHLAEICSICSVAIPTSGPSDNRYTIYVKNQYAFSNCFEVYISPPFFRSYDCFINKY
jgi:hypothetical protein